MKYAEMGSLGYQGNVKSFLWFYAGDSYNPIYSFRKIVLWQLHKRETGYCETSWEMSYGGGLN